MQESPGEGNSEEDVEKVDKERAVKVGGREKEREDGGSGESSGEEGSSGGSSGYCSTSPGAICATCFLQKFILSTSSYNLLLDKADMDSHHPFSSFASRHPGSAKTYPPLPPSLPRPRLMRSHSAMGQFDTNIGER